MGRLEALQDITYSLPAGSACVGGVSLAVSYPANPMGREEDVRDLLADFPLNRPQLSSTLHPPKVGTIRPKTNAESGGTFFPV